MNIAISHFVLGIRAAVLAMVLQTLLFLSPALATSMLVASHSTNDIREFDATTGAFIRVVVQAGAGGMEQPEGMAVSSDGTLYVGSGGFSDNGAVLRFDLKSGNFLGTIVNVFGSGVGDLEFAPNGHLLVQEPNPSDQDMSGVGEYDVTTGTLVRFITTGCCPNFTQMGVGPNGNLYVSLERNVKEYAFATGALLLSFASESDLGGTAEGLAFSPDGRLLIGTAADTILQYNPTTGQKVGVFSGGVSDTGLLKFGPDGDLYIPDENNGQVVRVNGTSGALVSTIPIGLPFPTYHRARDTPTGVCKRDGTPECGLDAAAAAGHHR